MSLCVIIMYTSIITWSNHDLVNLEKNVVAVLVPGSARRMRFRRVRGLVFLVRSAFAFCHCNYL